MINCPNCKESIEPEWVSGADRCPLCWYTGSFSFTQPYSFVAEPIASEDDKRFIITPEKIRDMLRQKYSAGETVLGETIIDYLVLPYTSSNGKSNYWRFSFSDGSHVYWFEDKVYVTDNIDNAGIEVLDEELDELYYNLELY